MHRLTAFVSGTVQKTGFRAQVVLLANTFGLKGYVQNLPDGRVKVVAEGDDPDLERFLKALKIRDAIIDVKSIEKECTSATGEFVGFAKMVDGGETDQRLDKAADLLKSFPKNHPTPHIDRDFFIISDEVRQWFIEERDNKQDLIFYERDPGKCQSPGSCRYKEYCC